MIPLSNGRSPRIDQFYATLRTYKSHQFQEDYNAKTEQEKSIEHIRSLGKQILEGSRTKKTIKLVKQNISSIHRSHQSLIKPSNLYDKYRVQTGKKINRQINRARQIIIKEEADRNENKIKPNKKYEEVGSKIQKKASNLLKGLNYAKKSDIEAQKLKKQKIQSQKIQKQMKQHQLIFQRSNQSIKIKKQFDQIGVLKRGEQMKARKQDAIERIRRQKQAQQMLSATFHPQLTSRRINGIQPAFDKRLSMTAIQKTLDQKKLIKQAIQQNSFRPQLNLYANSRSKIQRIWKQEKASETTKYKKSIIEQNMSIIDVQNSSVMNKTQPQTVNSTLQINLKDLNEISFIFE